MRPVIYLAGKISDPDVMVMLENITSFSVMENRLLKAGFAAVNPAADCLAVSLGGVSYEDVLEKDRAILERCDAVYFMRSWRESPGARSEHRWAARKNIPCVEESGPDDSLNGFIGLRNALER